MWCSKTASWETPLSPGGAAAAAAVHAALPRLCQRHCHCHSHSPHFRSFVPELNVMSYDAASTLHATLLPVTF